MSIYCCFLFISVATAFLCRKGMFCRRSIKTCQNLGSTGKTFPIQRIVAPLSLFPDTDNSCIAENFHVMRQRRLPDVQVFQYLTGTHFTGLQQFQNTEPIGITKGFKYPGNSFFIRLYCIVHPASLCGKI